MLIKHEQLKNCPPIFKNNCENYGKYCSTCKGKSEDLIEYNYKPIKNIGKHPMFSFSKTEIKENTIVQNNKDGRKIENNIKKKFNKKNMKNKKTSLSGSLFQDGDMTLTINNYSYNIEIKKRSNRNLFGPTLKEWLKAKKQFIHFFITSSKSQGDFICMELDLFLDIIKSLGG